MSTPLPISTELLSIPCHFQVDLCEDRMHCSMENIGSSQRNSSCCLVTTLAADASKVLNPPDGQTAPYLLICVMIKIQTTIKVARCRGQGV